MFTMIMKSASVAALLLAVFLSPSASYLIGLQFVVCLAACVAFSQAVQSRKLVWAVSFVAVAILFNPILPVVMPRSYSMVLDFLCLGSLTEPQEVNRCNPHERWNNRCGNQWCGRTDCSSTCVCDRFAVVVLGEHATYATIVVASCAELG